MTGISRTLVFIPTYNERENVGLLTERIRALGLDLDILFMDDNSPDGTGAILDALAQKNPGMTVLHRSGKLGIGSAHKEGIRWAYAHGYKTLVTMDCDFTHPPELIPEFLKNFDGADVVVGSRYMLKDSLEEWNLFRTVLTKAGHVMTTIFLRLPYDATGALRLYRLDTIPPQVFELPGSKGYSFLFESLFILNFNGFRIREVAIKLPARTYGHSKMKISDAWQSLRLLWLTFMRSIFARETFEVFEPFVPESAARTSAEADGWEQYWKAQKSSGGVVYDLIATFYRKVLIRPLLNHFIRGYFKRGDEVLHAGCGSGQVDADIRGYIRITALDYSVNALNFYKRVNGKKSCLLYGSIFQVPLPDKSMDGIYNLGVMEHFSEEDIHKILLEFKRVLKPGARAVLFWPPEFGLSVRFLKMVHFILQKALRKDIKLHPDEICRIRSRAHVEGIMNRAGFCLDRYYFGWRDMFTYVVIVISGDKA